MTLQNPPDWWDWELELTSHVQKRMEDRSFTEMDLRTMLQDAVGLKRDPIPGRWQVQVRVRSAMWWVIVEPDEDDCVIVVVTAYRS